MASRPLNPNAEPFHFEAHKLHYLSHPHLLYHASPFYPIHFYGAAMPCHQKLPVRYGGNRGKERRGRLTQNNACSACRNGIPFPNTIQEAHDSHITTVMIRNIPNQFKYSELLQILDEHCFEQNKTIGDPAQYSKFDFLYLPMDFRRHEVEKRLSNLGYAFVNFTTPTAAYKFYKRFHGFLWNVTANRKTCEINAAQYQGKDSLIRIFRKKVFRCKRRDFLPFVFSEARDGFNPQTEGTTVGNHGWGLPRKGKRS